jgi:outer membrane protein TolC
VGLTLSIPLINRSARADQIQGELQYRQAEVRLQGLQNQIRRDVRDAQFAVQQNRARVEAARKAVAYARESYEAEQTRYVVGMSTSVSVLQAQRDLTQASLVSAMAAYAKSHVDLDQKTGLTLANNNLDLSDAERGQVQKAPSIPDVIPAR